MIDNHHRVRGMNYTMTTLLQPTPVAAQHNCFATPCPNPSPPGAESSPAGILMEAPQNLPRTQHDSPCPVVAKPAATAHMNAGQLQKCAGLSPRNTTPSQVQQMHPILL
jgi:hypothetical protein